MQREEKGKKPVGIFIKHNIQLIVAFVLSTLLFFSAAFGSLPLIYQIIIAGEELDMLVFPFTAIAKFVITGCFIGAGFAVFGLFSFKIPTIVNLVRLFSIIFIVLLSILYISLRGI